MKFFAIGDIHGCSKQLKELLDKVKNFPEYKIVFLGDYLDRGPDAEGVINIMRSLDAIYVLGNHEQMLFNAVDNHPELFEEYLKMVGISKSSYYWLKTLDYKFETEDYIFTHAGLNPKKDLKNQTIDDYIWTFFDSDLSHITLKTVVQGHLHKPELFIFGNHIITDTNCGQGGYLTGVLLPDMIPLKSDTKSIRPIFF
ncbi:MAG: serine/threonine protein phosphatase [Leptospiraceae bacterium]|nr:serine/threonine protein phosphatase [Leptospiraceae bacterium]